MEGLKNAANLIPDNTFEAYDAVTLTETFLTTQWNMQNFYCIHEYATKGDRGRPTGGITMLLKPALAPFQILRKTKNILMVKTNLCIFISTYFQPEYKAEEIVEELASAMNLADQTGTIIVAGDLNCRIDTYSQKTSTVLGYMEEEGLTVVNDRQEKTYYGPNGTSTIDVVATNSRLMSQKVLHNIAVRKHIPVDTTVYIRKSQKEKHIKRSEGLTREIDLEKLEETIAGSAEINKTIKEGKLDEVVQHITQCIKRAAIPKKTKTRRAKQWFNKECYRTRREAIVALHKAKNTQAPEDLQIYGQKRKIYKNTNKQAKERHQAEIERRQIAEAEEKWYKVLTHKQPRFQGEISIREWETHFREVLQAKETRPTPENIEIKTAPHLFTVQEVERAIQDTKNNKACGPDGIYYEFLKATTHTLKEHWTALFNECLKRGTIPEIWRHATLKVLYKGKGDAGNPNSYRGIALECTAFKILTSLLTKRLQKTTSWAIPEQQFGFVKGRSTIHAVRCLQEDIEEELRHPAGKLHALFIDYTKAFDLMNRTLIMEKIEKTTGKTHETRLIRNILANNTVEIDDAVTKSKPIEQTNGVLQGDPISPLLFILATAGIPTAVKTEEVKMYAYADDMTLVSRNKDNLQEAFDKLVKWAEENGLELNEKKTAKMTFRKGGRRAANDIITLKQTAIKNVQNIKYLGITLQTQGTVFTLHIKERMTAAIKAIHSIKDIQRLSLDTAVTLFKLKIMPILTYGIEITWDHLKKANLKDLEKVKGIFLKKALCLSKYTPTRLVYIIARVPFLIEELRQNMPYTEAYGALLKELQEKREDVWEDFYTTDVMTTTEWRRADYELRHVITRMAVHGFHHRICSEEKYHSPNQQCQCSLCGKKCDRYHVLTCEMRKTSLTSFCRD